MHMLHTDMNIAILDGHVFSNISVFPSITIIFLAALFHQSVRPPLQHTCPDLCDQWAAAPLAECS